MNIESLVRRNIRELVPYSTARDECGLESGIFLDANESPFNNGFNRYPDPAQKKLKQIYSEVTGISSENLFAGNGSDEAIDLLIRVFCEPGTDNIVTISPTYGMYRTAAGVNNISCTEVPLETDFSLNPQRVLDACCAETKIIFLCSPNNPTGNLLNKESVETIIINFRGVVVVDEAYIDFSGDRGFAGKVNLYPNLVILRTLSKAWGMAGLRVGFAVASAPLISILGKVKYPYNVNILSQQKAVALLKRGNKSQLDTVISERERVISELRQIPDVVEIFPSDANFLLVRFKDSKEVFRRLLKSGIIVRDRSSAEGCRGALRIGIGTRSENTILLERLRGAGSGRALSLLCKQRSTAETMISVKIDPEGNLENEVSTGIPFFNHMLEQIPVHGGFSMQLWAGGDLENGPHHTIEDVAIVLGDALSEMVASVPGNNRYGFSLPMDESSASVLIDTGGRAYLKWEVDFPSLNVEGVDSDMFRHFFDSLSRSMKATIHVKAGGINAHHVAEAVFKAFARSLRTALSTSGNDSKIQSSKGVL